MPPSNLAFVDIETTGGRTSFDRIIEIGIILMEKGEIIKTYSSLINPQTHLPLEITRLTGITEQELESAPSFRDIATDIQELLHDSIFVAHNVRFDYGFLKTEYKRLNKTFSSKHFCTVRLSRALYPHERKHNLDSIIKRLNLSVDKRHRALDDARAIAEFFTIAQKSFSEEMFTTALKTVLKKPYLPVQLSSETLDTLPERPGVYIFYGQSPTVSSNENKGQPPKKAVPLYIGKSINIKNRVLSHFSGDTHSPLEMKIAQHVESIETIPTAGELGALFLESHLIKEMLPLFNRKLRRKSQLIALKQYTDSQGYFRVTIESLTTPSLSELSSFLGFFRSRKQAKNYLIQKVAEYKLCEKLLDLEKSSSSCFGYRLEKCKGACVAEEQPLSYNLRFQEAFSEGKMLPWPYQGTIVIEEQNLFEGSTDYFAVDKWCFLGKTTIDAYGAQKTTENEYSFDLDIYNILKKYLSSPKNAQRIKLLPLQTNTEETSSPEEYAY